MVWLLSGCAQPTKTDYSAYKQSKPKSILVLLPQNSTTEVQASHGLLSQTMLPLAEAGYYVFPVAVVNQIADTITDKNYGIAGITSARLLSAGKPNGILYGPRSPKYGKDAE